MTPWVIKWVCPKCGHEKMNMDVEVNRVCAECGYKEPKK